ncbi:MAG: vWA domain-containing protein [Steroidobacteraceae bacterium]
MLRRRRVDVFTLSFLDCICCGFGAVVLFYTIIAGQSGIKRMRVTDQLQAEVNRLEEEVLVGTRNLVVLRNTLQKTQAETAAAAARARQLTDEVGSARSAALNAGATSMAQREHINALKADLKQLEEGARRLQAGALQAAPQGERVRAFRGSGNRQYITGIRLKGKRVLVLVDRSASMMDEELDAIIKLRNQAPALRRAAPQWRQALDIADWLSTQFPAGSQFQMVAFNTAAASLVSGTDSQWLDPGNPQLLRQAIDTLRGLTPEGGTSLLNAWSAIRALSPRPDQVVLLTDGLPTQGADRPLRDYVNVAARTRLFDEARRALPANVPIDVILLPMQGDLPAPHRFWTMARETGGSFLMPARDWP